MSMSNRTITFVLSLSYKIVFGKVCPKICRHIRDCKLVDSVLLTKLSFSLFFQLYELYTQSNGVLCPFLPLWATTRSVLLLLQGSCEQAFIFSSKTNYLFPPLFSNERERD